MQLNGIYRGTVVLDFDPERRGRVMVLVPAAEAPSMWAEPVLSAAEARAVAAGEFVAPPKDTTVWVMFEDGDLAHPLWIGCSWPDERARQSWKHSDELQRLLKQ